jgi:hypothetical protein
MKSVFFATFAVTVMISTSAVAGETITKTPELALPEPEGVSAALPQSKFTEVVPLALPEPETEAIAPYKRCSGRETVYLTN